MVFGLDLILNVGFVDKLFFFNYSVFIDVNFFDLLDQFLHSDNLFLDGGDLDYLLFHSVCVYDLVDQSFYDFVVIDDNWIFCSDFDEARHFHRLLNHLLYFVYFGYFMDYLHDLVLVGSNLLDFLIDLGHLNDLLFDYLHFIHFLCDVWYYFFNLLHLL